MKDNSQLAALEKQIISLLAEQIGVEADDINLDDSLREDLHMGATQLTDFTHILQANGIDIEPASLNLSEMETVEELIETIASETDVS